MRFVLICLLWIPWEAATADWTQFRGPDGQGKTEAVDLPVHWGPSENIAWKSDVPGSGWSSPVVEGGQIWLTTATQEGQSLRALCYDRNDGKLIHDVQVFYIDKLDSINPKNTYASPTPVLTAEHVYVHFGTYGTACLNRTNAQIVWTNQELKLEHKEGPGSSPVLYKDRLIIPCDGTDVQFVAALQASTGRLLWKTKRSGELDANPDFRKAYSTPVVLVTERGAEAICVGADQTVAYIPANGEEIWKVRYKGFSNVPTPVLGEGSVFLCTDYGRPSLIAVRLGGTGDVTGSHVLWEVSRQVPAIPSALYLDGDLYLVSNGGVLSRLDAGSGKTSWQKRLRGTFAASPVYADGKIFLCSETGDTTVLAPPDNILAVNPLGEGILATPAIDGDSLFIRTEKRLYRIRKQ